MDDDGSARADRRLMIGRRRRLLLVNGDLGRRATLAVALGTRYVVHAAGSAVEAQRCAADVAFDVAILDSAVLQRALPPLVRVVRRRSPDVRLLMVAAQGDLRGTHYAATLGVNGKLGRRTSAASVIDRVAALLAPGDRPEPFDRTVGRAIDLVARDVTHLVDLQALADATGVALPVLAERCRRATGLTLGAYVAQVRVSVAQHLLRDTRLSMTTLAELLGFADADDLARAAGLSQHR